MDLTKAAPILCAGITMYSPLNYWGAATGEKKTVGIVGIGKAKALLRSLGTLLRILVHKFQCIRFFGCQATIYYKAQKNVTF